EVYTPKIAERLRFLKGKTIFSFSSSKLGRDLRRRFPEIRAVRIERKFPDAVRVQVQLFQPLALLKVAERDPQFVDAQGSLLREMHPLRCPPALPEIVVNSTGAVGTALKFVNLWSQSVSGGTEGLSTGSLRKVRLDSWGDFSLVLRDGDHETQVVWGPLDSESFDLQWKRFREVWSDLKKKSVSAGWINLRESVQDSKIVSGRREVVGRVIVRKS
ncbi:MAG: FtsQ-type POTRA domain-containing protein, partial [Elusimicrobia bacterium]|nr:FtsQ-type POTRA domain-containing protein [Elusimicrobiota bacterium]